MSHPLLVLIVWHAKSTFDAHLAQLNQYDTRHLYTFELYNLNKYSLNFFRRPPTHRRPRISPGSDAEPETHLTGQPPQPASQRTQFVAAARSDARPTTNDPSVPQVTESRKRLTKRRLHIVRAALVFGYRSIGFNNGVVDCHPKLAK